MSDSNEFAELLWENGQAVVHGRRKQPPPPPQAAFPPFTCGGAASSSRAQEKHPGTDPVPVALLKTGGLFADFSSGLGAPRDNGDLDDTVPWIHYPIVEEDSAAAPALADSYSPDFLSELHAAAATSLSPLPQPVQHTGDNRSTPVPNPSTGRGSEPSKETNRVPIPIPGPARRPEPHAELAAARKPRPESGGEGLVNFSIFSRPAAMARASLQRPPQTGTDKASNATTSTRVESTVLQLASGPRTAPAVFMDQRTAWSQSKEVRFSCAAAPTTAADLQQERPSNNMTPPQKKVEAMKASEAAGATSSVCSGNGAGTGNDESWRQQKRKSQAECSASQDDDPDDESGGMRRSCSRGAKRSRTAEVHNLSERRRRDRINEKMRALQELIPNCNKIDKASMLDEAIEYLKTLQLQVQMMSMGSGLCIPPMLLPPAMQHLQIPPIAHFPHLGMGLGYGMGVLDMNSTAAVPFPPMPGAHFPCPMIPGAPPQGLGMPGRNTMPVFGVPGQAIQPFPSLAGLPVRPDLAPPQASAAMANVVHEQQQGVATQQQQQSLNNEAQQGANTGDTQLQTIVQGENQRFSVPPSAQTESNQFLDGGGNMTTTGRNEAET